MSTKTDHCILPNNIDPHISELSCFGFYSSNDLILYFSLQRPGALIYKPGESAAQSKTTHSGKASQVPSSVVTKWMGDCYMLGFASALRFLWSQILASHSCRITCKRSESAREQRIALYKSNHHHHHQIIIIIIIVRAPGEIKRSRDLRGGRWSWTLTFAQKRS